MTTKQKRDIWAGVTALFAAAVVFTFVVFVAVRYGTDIEKVNWRIVAFMCGGLVLVWVMYQWNAGDTAYDVKDLLMTDGKANLEKHIIAGFALLSIWVVVQQALANKPVETLLLGVLGIFVAKGAAENVAASLRKEG